LHDRRHQRGKHRCAGSIKKKNGRERNIDFIRLSCDSKLRADVLNSVRAAIRNRRSARPKQRPKCGGRPVKKISPTRPQNGARKTESDKNRANRR
jgi:hypothetical protein